MVSPLHRNDQVQLKDDKVVTPIGELAIKPDIRPELLLKLSGQLQTTLELSQLLEMFFNEIQYAVLVDGISFNDQTGSLAITKGKTSQHTANYRLQTQEDCMGNITFHRTTRFREHELANLEGLLTTLVYPMRNALRYHEALAAAFRDPLTGAGNRVALTKTLSREIELAKRHNQSLSLLMLDLDYFKQINDEFGHSTGDKVLKGTVKCIGNCIRQTDMCFRYGGEEFLVMLSNASQSGALRIAERIRMSIAALMFQHPKGNVHITVSAGCATLRPEDNMDSLLQRADDALYEAKSAGRDKVISDADAELEILAKN